ncbi:WD domain-containing protein [Cladophialophora immunda]|nr:WD domain-containing protein [Cladophialophora immunda]
MLTESFIAATLTANKAVAHASAVLKDVGIFLHEFQPQRVLRHGFKKSSSQPGCVAISDSHIFAAQADKAVVNVYSRERANQEATVPFPERVSSLAYAREAEILVLGTEGGRLILWEVATGRVTNSAASHLQAVSCLCITPRNEYILSGAADSSIHVWSLAKLVSFAQSSDSYEDDGASNAPIETFSSHRTAISALICGHSSITTNFAVSASNDGTCHIWHIQSCQALRTLLLPSYAVSITLDPADRAIYFGCENGRIQSYDIFQKVPTTNISLSSPSITAAIQLVDKDSWKTPSADVGTANCVTLSYDGTSLLSGHANGTVIRWDVAKRRILQELTNFGQPITNIEMLKPEGFLNVKRSGYTISSVVKPNLEFTSMKDNGTCGVPAKYGLHVTITAQRSLSEHDEFEQAVTGPGLPQSMLDAAIRSLSMGNSATQVSLPADTAEISKAERLEEEVSKLKQQLAVLHDLEEKRRERKLTRMGKRDELAVKKREAYFEAKRRGKDGDAAMKKWEKTEAELDRESDEEDLGDGEEMDIG